MNYEPLGKYVDLSQGLAINSGTYNTLIKKIETINSENQDLAALRDFLLPMLMNGQVGFGEV